MSTSTAQPNPRFQCRHIHPSGHRCGSPALRQEIFCYFHHASRRPIPQAQIDARRGHQSSFTLPALEDRTAIQLAIGEIIQRIASNDLDPKRAGLLLYGLQIASLNLPKPAASPLPETIDEIVEDPTHGPLAPEAEYQSAPHHKSLEEILLGQWQRDGEEKAARLAEKNAPIPPVPAPKNSDDEDDDEFLLNIQASSALPPLCRQPPRRQTRYPQRVPASFRSFARCAVLGLLCGSICAAQQTTPALSGVVTDQDGATIADAQLTLKVGTIEKKTVSDAAGRFTFTSVPAGAFTLTVSAQSLATSVTTGALKPNETEQLPNIVLGMATASDNVLVTSSNEELAESEVKVEEHQRLVGVIPNFYVSYDWKAPSLNVRQKYQLGYRTVLDPVNLIINAGFAGIQQAANEFSGYHQGASGYFKRFGALNADFAVGTMLGGSILPALFHQDPRYFYMGTGTIKHRTLYALSTAVIARGDNGKWQPAYASILGDLSAGAVSNLYYPAANRQGATLTFENGLLGIAFDGVGNVIQEFLLRRLTHNPPTYTRQADAP